MTASEFKTHVGNLELIINGFTYWEDNKCQGSGFDRKFNQQIREREKEKAIKEFIALCKKVAEHN
jgi:hypothetical protein